MCSEAPTRRSVGCIADANVTASYQTAKTARSAAQATADAAAQPRFEAWSASDRGVWQSRCSCRRGVRGTDVRPNADGGATHGRTLASEQRSCETDHMTETEQLAALARIDELLRDHGIEYWLFGGWAVDFHAGSVTRAHHDLDLAVWLKDHARIAALLEAEGWEHAPEAGEDGYTVYERGGVRLELAFLARDEDGTISTPLREGRAAWPDQAFGGDIAALLGVRARVMSLRALIADKSEARDDPAVAAKDRADVEILSRSAN